MEGGRKSSFERRGWTKGTSRQHFANARATCRFWLDDIPMVRYPCIASAIALPCSWAENDRIGDLHVLTTACVRLQGALDRYDQLASCVGDRCSGKELMLTCTISQCRLYSASSLGLAISFAFRAYCEWPQRIFLPRIEATHVLTESEQHLPGGVCECDRLRACRRDRLAKFGSVY